MFEHWETEYQKVRAAGPGFRRQHAWGAVLKELVSLVKTVPAKDPDQARQHIKERFAYGGNPPAHLRSA